jgi:hypothetical protein
MTEHADSRYALVRLHCRQHHRDHWLVIQHVPWPPPSADVLRHALRRFDCQGRPFAVDIVATFPSPLGVPWSDLIPDAVAGNGTDTATPPHASTLAGTDGPAVRQAPGVPGPGRGRGGHLIDEAYRLGLTPLAPPAHVQAQAPDTVAPATASPTHMPAPAAMPAVRAWRTVRRSDGRTLTLFLFQPFPGRRHAVADVVVGVWFSYDAGLVEDLKAALRQQRDAVRQANPMARVAGGWLPAYHCWYIEPPAWPAVAALLRQYGYPTPDTP